MNLSGLGIWIWQIKNCEGGNWDAIIQKCLDHGIGWIAVKTGESSRAFQWNKDAAAIAIKKCHDSGIKILGWHYSRPTTTQGEIGLIVECLSEGLDGWCIDAEIEWQNEPNANAKAEDFMSQLREKVGNNVFIAHAPFPFVSYHQPFPYATFGKYVDAVMPQSYWTELVRSVSATIEKTDADFNAFNKANPQSARPVYPIGVSYGQGYPGIKEPLTKEDVLYFLNHYSGQPISFYSYDASANFPQFWGALAEFKALSQLSPPQPSVVNIPVVIDHDTYIPSPVKTKPNILTTIISFILSLLQWRR